VFPLQGGFGITVPGATHVFIMTDDGLVSAFQDHIGYLWDAGDGPVWVWSYDQHGNVSARTNVARLIRKVKAPVVRVHQRNRKVQVNLLTDITSEEVVSVQVLGKGDRVIKKTRLNATRKDIVFRVTAAERLKVCYLVERKRTGCALVKIPRAAASRASVRR
jgi:predicted nucleic acid-binding protein